MMQMPTTCEACTGGGPASPIAFAAVKVGGVPQRILLALALLIAAVPAGAAAPAVPKPTIVQRPIPFGAKRKQEMAAYARRHYGIDTYRLAHPHVIVEHYTVTSTFSATWNTFAS